MQLQVTPEQLKKLAYEHKITSWTCDSCAACDYPIRYRFQNGYPEVEFDPGCKCTDEVLRQRYQHSSWEEVAAFINMQSDLEKIKEIKKFWKL